MPQPGKLRCWQTSARTLLFLRRHLPAGNGVSLSSEDLARRDGEMRSSHAEARGGSAFSLRTLLDVLLLSAFAWAGMMVLFNAVIQSNRWDLPKGELLKTILSSCQVEHVTRENVVSEHMICPTRLSAHEFPQVLKDALLASEDERFYAHGAVDPRSAARALWHSLLGTREGGSTITQQLARSLLLKKEDRLTRKLREAVLAVRIFSLLSQDEILTRYLNAVPHARNLAGFDDPGRVYFGVGVQDLNLAEAALLVGMLPEPNNRDPLKSPKAAFDAGLNVLRHMREQGMVTAPQEARAASELERRVLRGELRRGSETFRRIEYRPYRDLALREARANGAKLGGDYRLILFVDAGFQASLIGQLCAISGGHEAAGAFLRPSGEVLALAGSCRYAGEWNRATDIARSIGSTGKLFPLIGAREAGIDLGTRVSTAPIGRRGWPSEGSSKCLAKRAVSLEFALAQSCNRPWTEMAMRLGGRLNDIVKRFGIAPPGSPSLVPIGGIETSPLKLAQSYAAVGNGGRLPNARFLSAAIGPRGDVLVVPAARPERRVLSSSTAASILQDLRGPVRKGTARQANSVHALVYGKTGTSSHNEDALFVGLTGDFVGSLWLGHDRPAPMPGVTGGGAPAKAFAKLTDFYYVRLAQESYAATKASEEAKGDKARRFAKLGPQQRVEVMLAVLVSLLMLSVLAVALFSRDERRVAVAAKPLPLDRDLDRPQAPVQT